ncbi:molybdate ABC transporter substrate-binding protein [uncultured Roseobacter sp.]|uniref:molybdate ABC transporter substrate-binding protein n=1 Tax=uncultured Roseobacter sp. TaxID=114847 RepID=UPI00263359E3|nr:molybdate ABC transporter substrate-binding protein [uncultured Roseobacter sp.]
MWQGISRHVRPAFMLALVLWFPVTGTVRADQITVFAAASLKTALDEIAADFETETGHDVTLAFAGTPVLARQISQGAPADIFLSASSDWMDWVEDRGALEPGNRKDLLGNALVLIGHNGNAAIELDKVSLRAGLAEARIAIALADAVPAGIYAKAALTHLGVWEALKPQLIQTDNARAALALVALGEAPFGIVYRSDAIAEPRVQVVATFPAASHPKIVYPMALLRGRITRAAQTFADYLTSDVAHRVFEHQGFSLIDEAS